jgi:ubiquinone/menaquinone biosynthesis C-methylase UbiE
VSEYESIRFTADPKRALVWQQIATYLAPWIDESTTTVELAAGYCDLSNALQSPRRVAIDISKALPQWAGPGVEAIVGDATDLSAFADCSIGTIFASNFLEHLEHDQIDRLLTECTRALKPGGNLILIQPNFALAPKQYFDDYTHRTIFTATSLQDRLRSVGFRIVRSEPRFLPLSMKSRLSFGYKLVAPYLKLPYRPLAGQMLVIATQDGT